MSDARFYVPEWDPRLSIGDSYVDAQHAILFFLVAQLKEALASDADTSRLAKILDEVKKYATFHFASEENFMADVDYPERQQHARIHTRMLVELSDYMRNVEIDSRAGHAALRFVEDWLNRHVACEDQKLAQYAQRSGSPDAS